jgi:hypothetical protein
VAAKVRHELVCVALDVPDDDGLVAWGTAGHKPLAGHVTFFETDRRTARETLSREAGACVGYHETLPLARPRPRCVGGRVMNTTDERLPSKNQQRSYSGQCQRC